MKKHEFTVETGDSPRLDVFLAEKIPTLTRSQAKNWIEQGIVAVDGEKARKAGMPLEPGMVIEAIEPKVKTLDLEARDVGIEILFEDDDLAVLDKPAGISVHPSATETGDTVVHGLLHKLKSLSSIGGVERPGIVHRIDKGTSGVLVVSKTDDTHHALAAQFKAHSIDRLYKALVYGDVERKMRASKGRIETFFGRHPVNRKKMTGKIVPEEGEKARKAITHWSVEKTFDELTLVECRLETGRTHQIRAHLSEMGFSVVGDPLYGDHARYAKAIKNPKLRAALTAIEHQLLHAWMLGFEHPKTGKRMRFESELPHEFLGVLELC